MTGPYAVQFGKNRQGPILFLVVILHAAVFYGFWLYKPRPIRVEAEIEAEKRLDLIWIKPPPPPLAEPAPAPPEPEKAVARRPRATPPPAPPPQVSKPEPEKPPQPANNDKKPLDLEKVLRDVSPIVRKFDSEDPTGQALRGEPQQPSFEAKLAKVLSGATPAPKFYEGARIEPTSTGPELDAGIRKYKITTFAGSYCVTYQDAKQIYVGSCPIKKF